MQRGITKREREVTDPKEILEILDKSMVVHLAMVDGDEPYLVPMNYGYTMEQGKLTLYLHSAVRGKKLEILRENPTVFFEMNCDLIPFEGPVPCRYGLSYTSLMGQGQARIIEDPEEKQRAMAILMKTQSGKDFAFNEKLVSIVSVIRIDVAEFTAKHRPLPETMR